MPFEFHNRNLRRTSEPMRLGLGEAYESPPEPSRYEFALDLNSYVIEHPEATFFVRVEGNAMESAGIQSGDLLIVDRSVDPSDGRIVLAVVDGDFAVRIFRSRGGKPTLESAGPRAAAPIELSEDDGVYVWGAVIGAVRKF